MKKRQQNIIKRMLDGEYFYSGGSPRMSKSEYRDLCDMGFRIQWARPRFEDAHYFLMKEFEQENKTLYQKLVAPNTAWSGLVEGGGNLPAEVVVVETREPA